MIIRTSDNSLRLPWTAQSPGRDVLCSDTLGRTWMLPEMVSDAFLAKAKIGACHRPSPPPPPPPLTVLLLLALSPAPDFSSCNLRIPNTWAFSLLLSASDRARSCSAGDAMSKRRYQLLVGQLKLTSSGRCENSQVHAVMLTVSER